MALLNDLTLSEIFMRIFAYLVVIAVHGIALAGITRLLGDIGPTYQGRLSANPFIHLTLPALAMAILFKLSWIAPMRIDPAKLRFGRWGLVVCGLGSLAAIVLLVVLIEPLKLLSVSTLPRTTALTALGLIGRTQDVGLWFVALNILPIPLMTGWLFAVAAWPKLTLVLVRYQTAAVIIVVALMLLGVFDYILPIRNLLNILAS